MSTTETSRLECAAGHIRRAFAPKLTATRHIVNRLQQSPVHSVMAFSSAAALFGAPGQANYAAANAAMDAYVTQKAAHGLPLVSVQWGAWGAGQISSDSLPLHDCEASQCALHVSIVVIYS